MSVMANEAEVGELFNIVCNDCCTQVTPVHHRVARRFKDVVVSLIHQSNRNVKRRVNAGQTPLYATIFSGYRYRLKLLSKRGASVNMIDNDRNTPLHFAVKKENVSIVSDLLMKGADLEQRNIYGQTVLQCAIVWNYSDTFELMVRTLLSKGAKVDTVDEDLETPLHSAAARTDSKSVCLLLLAKGANVYAKDKGGNTPLHIAALKQSSQAIVTLIEKGANIEARNKVCDTPLHIAVKSMVPATVKLLLEHKADVNATTINDKTALHLATQLGCDDVIAILIDHGANLEKKDYRGNTALHCAVKGSDGDRIASILLERGAPIDVLNELNETPLQLALDMNRIRDIAEAYKPILDWATSVNSENNVIIHTTVTPHQCDALWSYFIKLICAKIHLNINGIGNPMYMHFKDKVDSSTRELEKMKADRFGRHSLYDILLNYSDPTFLMNPKLKEAVTSPNFESHYPVYGSLLKITLIKAEKRFQLLNQAQNSLKIPIPKEIKRKILAYLDENSFSSVIKAFGVHEVSTLYV